MASLCWLLTSICSFLRIILLLDDAARFEPFFFFFLLFFTFLFRDLSLCFLLLSARQILTAFIGERCGAAQALSELARHCLSFMLLLF